MKIIIDNGGTKLDLAIVEDNHYLVSGGINVFDDDEIIVSRIIDVIPKNILQSKHVSIDFYTTGLNNFIKEKFDNIFSLHFPNIQIHMFSDMLAASRALFYKEPGIACILGTGSNCAYFDGVQNHKITSSLGYILGDEGSGYQLGKKLLIKYLNNELSLELKDKIEFETKLTQDQLISFIYSSKYYKSYIASFAIFLKKNESNIEINNIINSSILEFLETHPFKHPDFHLYKFGFIGSVAFNFQFNITEILNERSIKCDIIQKPIKRLVSYYQ